MSFWIKVGIAYQISEMLRLKNWIFWSVPRMFKEFRDWLTNQSLIPTPYYPSSHHSTSLLLFLTFCLIEKYFLTFINSSSIILVKSTLSSITYRSSLLTLLSSKKAISTMQTLRSCKTEWITLRKCSSWKFSC